MSSLPVRAPRGSFTADQIRSGEPYEVSRGHRLDCAPTGGDGSSPNALGATVLGSDPSVTNAGVDTGLKLDAHTLRAPDIAVNYGEEKPGWVTTVPPLAVEYAAATDEDNLATKIGELLDAGTRWVWVVRLAGPRRVEVYEQGAPMRVVGSDGELSAPGVLQLPVPVRALYDRSAAHETTLRNLLARKGYASLDAIRNEGRDEGRDEGSLNTARANLRVVLAARNLPLTEAQRERIETCTELDTLTGWLRQAALATTTHEVFDPPRAP